MRTIRLNLKQLHGLISETIKETTGGYSEMNFSESDIDDIGAQLYSVEGGSPAEINNATKFIVDMINGTGLEGSEFSPTGPVVNLIDVKPYVVAVAKGKIDPNDAKQEIVKKFCGDYYAMWDKNWNGPAGARSW